MQVRRRSEALQCSMLDNAQQLGKHFNAQCLTMLSSCKALNAQCFEVLRVQELLAVRAAFFLFLHAKKGSYVRFSVL